MTDDTEVSETRIDRAVASAFGRAEDAADPALETLFREAGFSDELAQKGAQLMESGLYFGFEDAASSLIAFGGHDAGNKPIAPRVCAASIAEAAKKVPAEYRVQETS